MNLVLYDNKSGRTGGAQPPDIAELVQKLRGGIAGGTENEINDQINPDGECE